jgi:lysophospholipase L1-like esterase
MTKNNNIEIETTIENSISKTKLTCRKSWKLNLFAVMIGFAMIGGILCVLDILAQRELIKTGEALPKICTYRPEKWKQKKPNPNKFTLTINDPLLGRRYDIKTGSANLVKNHLPYIIADKFKIFIRESDLAKFPSHSKLEDIGMTPDLVDKLERPIIVCLGGSTTFAFLTCRLPTGDFEATGSWAEELSRIMENKRISGTVFCGGSLGYKTSQDLLKLLRDVLEIKPDIVISYGGHNDCGSLTNGYHLYPSHFFWEARQKKIPSDKSFILPNLVRYVRKIAISNQKTDENRMYMGSDEYWGIKSKMSPHEYMIRNWKIMNEICKLHDIEFWGVLQPFLGSSDVTRNNGVLTEKTLNYYSLDDVRCFASSEQLFDCYDRIRPELAQYGYMQDFSGIFDKQTTETIYTYFRDKNKEYRDMCHVNQKGNRIIAENMFQMLFEDKATINLSNENNETITK